MKRKKCEYFRTQDFKEGYGCTGGCLVHTREICTHNESRTKLCYYSGDDKRCERIKKNTKEGCCLLIVITMFFMSVSILALILSFSN